MRNLTKELRIAISNGKTDEVIALLEQGAPMIIEHFVLATQMELYDVLKLFLDRGWDINTDVDRLTPSALMYTFHDMTLLTWFLDHGADPNKRCQMRDCTPLSYAIVEAPFGIIELLFRYGGSIDRGQLLHYTAMRECSDNLEVLKFVYDKSPEAGAMKINKLLDEDCPQDFAMNFRAGLGTPLHYAALTGSLDCVKFLVEKGGNPLIRDPYGRTALSLAIYKGNDLVAQFLQDLIKAPVSKQEATGHSNVGIAV
ncbi:hypothetical protein DTO271D3_4754 [Paecilomyces variotii]|nr:hypothetical protein DTO207G8_1523 [Paecilomyces variotii]KAJ9315015.1 hypothetical protein DTO271D3_4754 [Paecilomyces variotii]